MIENDFVILPSVSSGLQKNHPVVALESTVITHGLAYPLNLETARAMDEAVIAHNAIPATIAILKGKVHIGLTYNEIEALAKPHPSIKISPRDVAGAVLRKDDGGTTVAGTMMLAHQVGIRVFATGGIGGVHRGSKFDISADLPMLTKTPMIVVCSGAKAILDLVATREFLETYGIPVVGYQSDEMAAFYTGKSGLKADFRAENPKDAASFARTHWNMGNLSGVLVTVPPPKNLEMDYEKVEKSITLALQECEKSGIRGSSITPFLLAKMAELTEGESVQTNTALLVNNANVAAEIALELNVTW